MSNPIKYSTGIETLALKKGNFYIGTGDVGKGPTSTTGYYNGITPPSGGYTVYLNKASGGPSIYTCANDTELISLTNQIAGTSYTTVNECLVYFAGQTDKMVLNRDYEGIVTDGLILNLDAGFTPSYPKSGTTWYDLSGNGNHCALYNSPSFSNGVFNLDGTNDYIRTINTLDLTSTNAVTVLYFFQPLIYGTSIKVLHELSSNFNSRSDCFVASYSDNSLGQNFETFASIKGNAGYNISVYNKNLLNDLNWHHHVIIHNTGQSSIENLIYSDGELATPIANPASGYANNNTNNFGNQIFYIASRGGSQFFCNINLGQVLMYNRALSSTEVLQNYNAQKSRFGL